MFHLNYYLSFAVCAVSVCVCLRLPLSASANFLRVAHMYQKMLVYIEAGVSEWGDRFGGVDWIFLVYPQSNLNYFKHKLPQLCACLKAKHAPVPASRKCARSGHLPMYRVFKLNMRKIKHLLGHQRCTLKSQKTYLYIHEMRTFDL